MFMTAGYLTEKITGRSWDDLVRERIFVPLGMTRANTSVRETPNVGDFAFPYTWRNDSLVRLPFRNIDAVGPAGSINASVDDMLKYIQFRLDRGEAGGKRLLSVEAERQIQSPQMVSGGGGEYPEVGHGTYGLGLGVSTYRGRKIVSHGGGIDGYISAMSWLPDERIGIMVLSNLSGNNPVPTVVMRTLYDRLLGAPAVDWVDRQRKADAAAEARRLREREARVAGRKVGTSPSHGLDAYAGTYQHQGYGTLVIQRDGDGLTAKLEPHRAKLEHYHYDVWEIKDPGGVVPFGGRIRFLTNVKGEVDKVMVPLEPNGAEIGFVRLADHL
jgi:hypothetical protein